MQPILEVKNLTKKFGPLVGGFTAVDNISFSVSECEIVGLLGPNGAGKTTTIQMLLGLITPTEGQINIFGKNFNSHREEILSMVNFSSTYTQMPWRLTVWENLYVVALLYSVPNPKKKIEEVIRKVGLSEIRDKTVSQLSTGWMTRINIARVFINTPKLMLLDEPTASLDPEAAKEIRAQIITYQKVHKSTILWTSHNMAEVEEVCDRVIFLKDGKIIAVDTPLGLAKTIPFCHISLLIEEKDYELLKETRSIRKISRNDKFTLVEINEEEIPGFLNFLSEKKIPFSEISIDKPTLEDYFISKA